MYEVKSHIEHKIQSTSSETICPNGSLDHYEWLYGHADQVGWLLENTNSPKMYLE